MRRFSITRFSITSAVLLTFAAAGFGQSVEDHEKLMKSIQAANGKLQKTVATDLPCAATLAAELKTAFVQVEQFWAKNNVADAQTFSKNSQQAADDVQAAAKAGNTEGAVAAAKKIGAGCMACHSAHREKLPDGTYKIK